MECVERLLTSARSEVLPVNSASIARAVALLRIGGIVAIPTETVYGLAADATNGPAVAKIFAAKGRPSFNPLICHVASLAMAETTCVFDQLSQKLAKTFWPGPLTLVLPLNESAGINGLVTAGLSTIALRMPRGVASEIITLLGRPLAAPSANSSGRISATSAEAVNADLGASVPLILDGGPAPVGLESTIVKVEGGKAFLLRPGGLAAEEIEAALGTGLIRVDQRSAIEAPGMLESHYAPEAALRMNAAELLEGEALLAFGGERASGAGGAKAMLNLSPSGNLHEAAANLFAYLRELDRDGVMRIAVEPIPGEGLGEAINDRLRRAAAPRGGI
jgi:L-threonylcarbamoyladenylate synthase